MWAVFTRERQNDAQNYKTFTHVFKKKQKINQRPVQVIFRQGDVRNEAGNRIKGISDPDPWLESDQLYFPEKHGFTPFIFSCFPMTETESGKHTHNRERGKS